MSKTNPFLRASHTETPKYRCPRCLTRTCSLQCTKRHKKWAQCSGLRDPGAYKKRSEVATPAGIDQDYNFISGIEKRIESAGRDTEDRGVILKRHVNENDNGPAKGEVNLKQALRTCGVFVERAPVGMSRQRDNKTYWKKIQKCINWTVEWVFPDGQKVLGNCLETETLATAFARTKCVSEPNAAPDSQPPKKKRKKKPQNGENENLIGPVQASPPSPQPALMNSSTEASRSLTFYIHDPRPGNSEKQPKQPHHSHLRIHEPHLFSKIPDIPFSKVLEGHTVLEFPTIHVFGNGDGPDTEHEKLQMKEKRSEEICREEEVATEVAGDPTEKVVEGDGTQTCEPVIEEEKSGVVKTTAESIKQSIKDEESNSLTNVSGNEEGNRS
ncbi:MAG: hypothetical protein MMC33_004887 [Icmadophila ericetorum]|nr:hypothetical protein [Icmadophila ericetorum]